MKTSVKSVKETYNHVFDPSRDPNRLFRLSVLVSLGLGALNFLVLLVLAAGLRMVATRPLPNFVQLANGDTIDVRPVDPLYRDGQTIKDFVSGAAYLLFSWSNRIATDENGERKIKSDPGVSVGENLRVTTPAWEASFALGEDFRSEFLKGLAALIPPEVWGGRAYASVKFVEVADPISLAPGKWEVKIVANLIVQDARNPGGRAIPLNKSILVRAVDNPPLPLPEVATPLQRTVNKIRASRLEITEIRDLETDNP
jgi:hypothetical protein